MSTDPSPDRVPSYGNMSEHHWSRSREERNREEIEYYRERSRAPGVEEGGSLRNFYCMECDGVIPLEGEMEHCPHCGASIEGQSRRYFNWVEIDRPVESDARALLPWMLLGLFLVAGLVFLLLRVLS